MQAVLIKSETWDYVNGREVKPEETAENANAVTRWMSNDEKAKADIILSIKPSLLKQVKECRTSRELWLKLQTIYQSSGPTRKATLIKKANLPLHARGRRRNGHIQKFFDTADKLNEMEVDFDYEMLISYQLCYCIAYPLRMKIFAVR